MPTPDQLFTLVERIRLILTIRDPKRTDDKSTEALLDSLSKGIEELERGQRDLEDDSQTPAKVLRDREDVLIRLRTIHDDLTAQFQAGNRTGASGNESNTTYMTAETPLDHKAVGNTGWEGSLRHTLATNAEEGSSSPRAKTVRFTNSVNLGDYPGNNDHHDPEQVFQVHQQILEEQDDHLDRLGESISRQRLLSIQIGDELENQVQLLDSVDDLVDRASNRLGDARRKMGIVAKEARDHWSLVVIVVLILILVILIVILK